MFTVNELDTIAYQAPWNKASGDTFSIKGHRPLQFGNIGDIQLGRQHCESRIGPHVVVCSTTAVEIDFVFLVCILQVGDCFPVRNPLQTGVRLRNDGALGVYLITCTCDAVECRQEGILLYSAFGLRAASRNVFLTHNGGLTPEKLSAKARRGGSSILVGPKTG
jgi:hypothetical protein